MTPIPHAIAADSTLPVKDRRHGDLAKRLRLLDGLHFFECSAIYEMAVELSEKMGAAYLAGQNVLAFLPAPRVMIDFAVTDPTIARQALILDQRDDGCADVTWVVMGHQGQVTATDGVLMVIPLNGADDRWTLQIRKAGVAGFGDDQASAMACMIYALLAMINTPRIIGRRQRNPHAGLQRKLAAEHRLPGKYPLHAWHELVLEVRPPADESAREPREARLTGEKARHFVRCHIRIRIGRLEMVTAHWRGNEALGIKQTRYRIQPGAHP